MDKNDAIDIIQDAGFGFLSTMSGNKPNVRPMMPYLTDDMNFLLAVLPRSRTIQDVQGNPNVEFCFVDRKMSYCRVAGRAALSNDIEQKKMVWSAIPMLRQYFSGPEDQNFNLIVVKIESMEAMTPHQKIPESITF